MELDVLTRDFAKDPEVFAELFNTFLFEGKRQIEADRLMEKDVTEILADEKITKEKFRDLKKLVSVMSDGKTYYMLLGIENQAAIHEAMPIRVMIYDALSYDRQVKDYEKKRKQKVLNGELKQGNPMKRFEDFKAVPVVTMTLYWGDEEWNAPQSLKEMFDPETVKEYGDLLNDYRIHLYSIRDFVHATEEEIDKLHSNLKDLAIILSLSEKEEGFEELPDKYRTRLENMDLTTAELARILTKSDVMDFSEKNKNKEEKVDMCKAVDHVLNKGIGIGRSEGIEIGRSEGGINMLCNLFEEGTISLRKAIEKAEMSEEEFLSKYEDYKNGIYTYEEVA